MRRRVAASRTAAWCAEKNRYVDAGPAARALSSSPGTSPTRGSRLAPARNPRRETPGLSLILIKIEVLGGVPRPWLPPVLVATRILLINGTSRVDPRIRATLPVPLITGFGAGLA